MLAASSTKLLASLTAELAPRSWFTSELTPGIWSSQEKQEIRARELSGSCTYENVDTEALSLKKK